MTKFPQADRMMRKDDMMNRGQADGDRKLPFVCPGCSDGRTYASAEALRKHREKTQH